MAPDWIGWGTSERPLDALYDYHTERARLLALLDVLGLERVNLVSHDYGGFLGLGLAVTHPDRVARLAILNSRAHATFVPRWWLLFGAQTLLGRLAPLRLVARHLPWRILHERGLARELRLGVIDRPSLQSYLGWMSDPRGRDFLLRFSAGYDVRTRPELSVALERVGCPTAVIWGPRTHTSPSRPPTNSPDESPAPNSPCFARSATS